MRIHAYYAKYIVFFYMMYQALKLQYHSALLVSVFSTVKYNHGIMSHANDS